MKKNLFFYAMAFCIAVCNVACGSDDDNDNNGNNNNGNNGKVIPAPVNADKAVAYTIPSNAAPAKSKDLIDINGAHITAELTAINITESEKAIIEVTTTDDNGNTKRKYRTFDVHVNGDTYTVKDGANVIGTIEKKSSATATRGTSTVGLVFHLTLTINGITGVLEFVAADPITAKAMEGAIANSDNLTSIARTWTVKGMKLVLDFKDKSKTDASTIVAGGDLRDFIALAEDNGVKLSEKDKADLSKTILSITIDKNGQFALTYEGGASDVADWNWVSGSKESKLQITLKDKDMGNKFLKNDSHVEVEYHPETKSIILALSTYLTDDDCDASLVINLI